MKADVWHEHDDALILIVDDVPKNIQLLGKILDNNGYRIAAVTKGDQVKKAAEKHNPDLILLDIMMPGKTGYEVCEELKADDELSDIPIIFLTARSEEEDIIKGLNLGGADYVTKPFNTGELLARIDTHLSLKRARDQIVKQQEELVQLTKTKEKLYSIIAHDLKNALFGTSGLTEVLQRDIEERDLDDDLVEKFNLIFQSSQSATEILENLLDWTRLQTNKLDLSPEEFSLSQSLEECIDLYQTQAGNKNIDIQLNAQNTRVNADKQMMSTVFRNLISNAIKFSEDGGEIRVSVDSNNEDVTVFFEDDGVGMSEEVRQNVFNPTERPDTKEKEEGTGLGLLLCKEFIELHEGEISVDSNPGEGTTFEVQFPVEIKS